MAILGPPDIVKIMRARKHGARYAWTIIREGLRVGLSPSTALALIEQESGFRNVFGHDPTIFVGAGTVTERKYKAYKRERGHTRMQGVGPAQLTWWEFQDKADRLGGCWRPKYNVRVGFELLSNLIKDHGLRKGLAVYNGGIVHPNYLYADEVLARQTKWKKLI